jgi:hypothetical protein
MSKKVAILQSNYIPWKGYFDIISQVDEFVFHDDLQYTKGDWRNRNQIITSKGKEWLTIPCGTSEKRLICEVFLADHAWQKKHWQKIKDSYKKAHYFERYEDLFSEIYLARQWTNLSELNQYMIQLIAKDILGLDTVFDDSRKYNLQQAKSDRVLELVKKLGADIYLSGPAAKAYLDEEAFRQEGISVEWMAYSDYPVYPQFSSEFSHHVSVLDLIFHCGPDSKNYIFS